MIFGIPEPRPLTCIGTAKIVVLAVRRRHSRRATPNPAAVTESTIVTNTADYARGWRSP